MLHGSAIRTGILFPSRSQMSQKPNKALEPTRPAVTDRAPSSTLRASWPCGSSLTFGRKLDSSYTHTMNKYALVFVVLSAHVLVAAENPSLSFPSQKIETASSLPD